MQHKRTTLFNFEKQPIYFLLYWCSLWRKINVDKLLKLWENCGFIFNFNHILKFKNFRVWHVSFTTTAVPSSSRNLVCLHLTHSTNCLSPLNWQHRFVMPCHFTCFVTSYHGLVMLPLLWRSTCWCHNCIIFSLFTLTPPLCGIYFAHFYILLQLVLLC